ncbi:gap junction delta-3 protein [Solea senegalensis]|uniref:Gap junction delta-3 protein n=1 Tax=Solea senegalensis TaxID=28829 RepID=A0AAV6RNJ5_SOLSE|nr:gap junction delta-3 protein-like [Solea senegalensis]KAG7507052.1 gap junction delta-3 protein [Solea senegalensis]
MGEWSYLGGLFDSLQAHSPMLGRFWLLIMLVFRILILGTVASDLFEDEQEEFACNTLQPGCKQVCYDMAFPISQYRFWVFHIVLIATPSLIFLMYTMHQHNKRADRSKFGPVSNRQLHREDRRLRRFYIVNVAFRIVAEVGFLVGQWLLYGFKVEAQFPCSRFPCPYTVDCFTSRPAEKTVFLCFYFVVGVVAAISSCIELFYSSLKWFCTSWEPSPSPTPLERSCDCQNLHNIKQEEAEAQDKGKMGPESVRLKGGSLRSSRKSSSLGHKTRSGKYVNSKTFMV